MKILCFAGSNSSQSINQKLVRATMKHFEGQELTLVDLNDYETSIFSIDREKKGFPYEIQQFVQLIAAHDAIIVSLAENNSTYTAAFKNILDWSSRLNLKFFAEKPMLLMSTSPGGYGGGNVMNAAKNQFPKHAAQIVETFSLPAFQKNFDVEKLEISDNELKSQHLEKIEQFKKALGI